VNIKNKEKNTMSKSLQKIVHFAPLMVLAVAVLAACGGGGAASGGSPVQVQVTLHDFSIDSSLTTFSVGVPYHFVVTNKGAVDHEFAIMPPEQGAQGSETQLPSTALAGILGKDLTPGATKTLDYTFTKAAPAGSLEFACHLPGHYEAGMHTPIVVQ
jgi:uncharacterized cupredoxin-like copper-binding protein